MRLAGHFPLQHPVSPRTGWSPISHDFERIRPGTNVTRGTAQKHLIQQRTEAARTLRTQPAVQDALRTDANSGKQVLHLRFVL
jgi:hypothetical protein